MPLQRLDKDDVTAIPQICNIALECEICGRAIPPCEEYYDVQLGHGSGQVCADHDIDDILDWTEGE